VRVAGNVVVLRDERSPAAQSMRTQPPAQAYARRGMPDVFPAKLGLDAVFLVPIIAAGISIALCAVGREASTPCGEQERTWMEAAVGMIASSFEGIRAGGM